MSEQIFSGSKTIKELFAFLNKYLVIKEEQTVTKECKNCIRCVHEFDGEYGQIDCGYYCDAVDFDDEINTDKNFPFKYTKECFVLSDRFTEGYCVWSVINECEWLKKEQQNKIYHHFIKKQLSKIKIQEVKEQQ